MLLVVVCLVLSVGGLEVTNRGISFFGYSGLSYVDNWIPYLS